MRTETGQGWFGPALAIALAVTTYRVVMLWLDRTDLFVDEAQYWLWGQEMALGYYSKPPLIGWVIRASTEIGGSDAAFWIRLPAPLLHMVTGLLLGALAAPRLGRDAAIWITATYVTLPMIVVGSLMISTDTVMVPFLVLALWAWMRGLERGGSTLLAILAGVALGIGFLAKYAAIYYVLCAGLAATFMWQGRPGWRPALAGLAAFLLTISPNIIWNLQNGLSTFEHTMDNADWVRDPGHRASLNFAGLGEFFGSQFAVFGPVLFAGLLWLGGTARRRSAEQRILVLFSLPIIAIVCVQALLSEAYANWAASAYVAGTLLVVPWFLTTARGLLWVTMGFNLVLVILLPLSTVIGTGWKGPDGDLLLERYVGRTDMSAAILQAAAAHNVETIVANDRDILADLMHQGRDADVAIFARPTTGRAPNHYVLKHALPADSSGPVLFVSKYDDPPKECDVEPVGTLDPDLGAYAERPQRLYIGDASCLVQPK